MGAAGALLVGGDGTVRGGTEIGGRGIGVWRGADGGCAEKGLDCRSGATAAAPARSASGGAVAVSVAGSEVGGGAANGDDVAIGCGVTTGGICDAEDGDGAACLRALGGGGGMLRGAGAGPSMVFAAAAPCAGWPTVEAAGSGMLGALLRRGGGGGADGLGRDISPSGGALGTDGLGIEGSILLPPLGLGGAATGRGGTAELPELPLFDPSFSDTVRLKIVEREGGRIAQICLLSAWISRPLAPSAAETRRGVWRSKPMARRA